MQEQVNNRSTRLAAALKEAANSRVQHNKPAEQVFVVPDGPVNWDKVFKQAVHSLRRG